MVLMISPHPDDIEIGCSGTICRLVSRERPVEVVVLTAGEASRTPTMTLDPDTLAEKRQAETRRALSFLGIENVYCFSLGDLELTPSRVSETLSPFDDHELVMSPPLADDHPDHTATAAGVRDVFDSADIVEYETPSASSDFDPTLCVEVTPYVEQKIAALRFHRTQQGKQYMTEQAVREKMLRHCESDVYCEPFREVSSGERTVSSLFR